MTLNRETNPWAKSSQTERVNRVRINSRSLKHQHPNPTRPLNTMADPRPLPTPVAMLIGTAIVAGISGYMIGIASSLGLLPIPFMPKAPVVRGIANYDDEEESEEEDVEESMLDHAPNWANGFEADKRDGLRASAQTASKKPESSSTAKASWEDSTEECKLVLVVRTDLGMTKGLT
jgi:PTH2 family peptidyl-tRNA hydrolase